MGKIWVEVSLISARGLRRSSSLWKLQWFAVGWIEPSNKYCTKIDASGNANPVWKTKFATLIDDSNLEDLALHVEVYGREPIFLRERLQGTATILLKEFLAKYSKSSESSCPGPEEGGSYQLRKRNSNKSEGFIDVSIRISKDNEEPGSYAGKYGGVASMDSDTITLSTETGLEPPAPVRQPESQLPSLPNPRPYPANHPSTSEGPSHMPVGGLSYHPPLTAPPPPLRPPPSSVGYIPNFLPNTDYMNIPSFATASGRGPRPGVAMGVGAGALAAGAVIFGDHFMSGFRVPTGLQDHSLTISTDPPF